MSNKETDPADSTKLAGLRVATDLTEEGGGALGCTQATEKEILDYIASPGELDRDSLARRSYFNDSLSQEGHSAQLQFSRMKIDISASKNEEREVRNFPSLDEPRPSYTFPSRDSLGQPIIAFPAKSTSLPCCSSSLIALYSYDAEPEPKISKWASLKNRLMGQLSRGPRVMNPQTTGEFDGQEAGPSKGKDSSSKKSTLEALDLDVPKYKRLMPWSRIKQAMRRKKSVVADQSYDQNAGCGQGGTGKKHDSCCSRKSQGKFGLGWMQKAGTEDSDEEVQDE